MGADECRWESRTKLLLRVALVAAPGPGAGIRPAERGIFNPGLDGAPAPPPGEVGKPALKPPGERFGSMGILGKNSGVPAGRTAFNQRTNSSDGNAMSSACSNRVRIRAYPGRMLRSPRLLLAVCQLARQLPARESAPAPHASSNSGPYSLRYEDTPRRSALASMGTGSRGTSLNNRRGGLAHRGRFTLILIEAIINLVNIPRDGVVAESDGPISQRPRLEPTWLPMRARAPRPA
jgi:hypothetical protein